jgi:HD superfamily phosphohydrolase
MNDLNDEKRTPQTEPTPQTSRNGAAAPFFAHSTDTENRSNWHLLSSHLAGSAKQCTAFAQRFGVGEIGRVAALLHDVGKYSREFQEYLRGGTRVEHSTAGAKIASTRWPGPEARAHTQNHRDGLLAIVVLLSGAGSAAAQTAAWYRYREP